ncbi:hypothetical protein NLG97_g3572 [Lecanicillium saksenae]|uniref:Uncharacterized protein n=1 Tax=Lecanicillium saksenae TaxID=468837 RepID=A0ACC1QXW4_9HYPO|nr:hypothetical protein NLG97_g3572 [Lecanicillium saksenae]
MDHGSAAEAEAEAEAEADGTHLGRPDSARLELMIVPLDSAPGTAGTSGGLKVGDSNEAAMPEQVGRMEGIQGKKQNEGLVSYGRPTQHKKKSRDERRLRMQMTSWREVEAVQRPTTSSELAGSFPRFDKFWLEGGLGQALDGRRYLRLGGGGGRAGERRGKLQGR